VRIKLVIISITSLLYFSSAYAQVNDAGGWFFFMLEKDLPDKFTTGIEAEVRLNENYSEARSVFTEAFIQKEWSDAFSTSFTYRVQARKRLDNTYQERDRGALDLDYKKELGAYKVGYRFRLQRQLGVLGRESSASAAFNYRNKVKLSRDVIKKLDFSLAAETFHSTRADFSELTDIRFKASFKYKVKKRNYLYLGYLVQTELNRANRLTEFNTVLGYKLMIK